MLMAGHQKHQSNRWVGFNTPKKGHVPQFYSCAKEYQTFKEGILKQKSCLKEIEILLQKPLELKTTGKYTLVLKLVPDIKYNNP